MPINRPMRQAMVPRRSRQRGSALIEFVLCVSLFWVPLFLGTVVIGFNLIRAVQVTQVCRDAGHMYSYGIDFSQPAYQNLLESLAPGLNMTSTSSGASGVVVLTTVTYIDSTNCTAGGYSSNCANVNTTVITRQIVVGNTSLHASAFGTPPSKYLDSEGNVSPAGYLNDTTCQATGFSNVIPLVSGEFAYMSEMWVTSPSWWSYLGTTEQVSSRSIF